MPTLMRRHLTLGLLAAPLLQGCAAPLAALVNTASTPEAQALLASSAAAHGVAALDGMGDVSVSYAGEWRPFAARLQPDLVDAGFRGRSEERLLLRDRLLAQDYGGPDGRKQVVRPMAGGAQGSARVWLNGQETADPKRRAAAALVADAYGLFLLGPMLLARPGADRTLVMALSGTARIEVGGEAHDCDVLRVDATPGLGFSAADQLALNIDRRDRLMRRVGFTLEGLEGTRNALAEVDAWGHVPLGGVRWPTRFYERLARPAPLPVHDWRMTGLDVGRGLDRASVDGPAFTGAAARPAAALA